MKTLYNYTMEQLNDYMATLNQKPFRSKQIFQWLYQKQVFGIDEMSDISKDLREKISYDHCIDVMDIVEKQISRDGTIKYLMKLQDGLLIEAVLMQHDYGKSICITSQVGCNMKCQFCASGLLTKQRDLTSGEMVGQVLKVQADLVDRISHVVVMGIGEPFDNYDNVMDFVSIINHPHGLAIGARHITISTSGLIPGIEKYATTGVQTNLAISLHAPNDEIRNEIMPINKAYPLDQLRKAIIEYTNKTNRRVTFEYILLKDLNDTMVCARQLAHFVKGLNAYVNLIPYNPVSEHGYQASSQEVIEKFKTELLRFGINVTVRREHGRDIDGACGQLRAKRNGV